MRPNFPSLLLIALAAACAAPGARAGTPCPADHCVRIVGNAYEPASLEVWVGETVRFEYSGAHPFRQVRSATGTTPFTPDPVLCDELQVTRPDCQVRFDAPGDFFYICVVHAFMDMRGVVRVFDPVLFRDSFD